MNRALFLDRDGVINQDLGYVHSREKCIFYPEIFDVIRLANETGYKVIIVTNQAGIGRGYYTENVYLEFMRWVMNELVAPEESPASFMLAPIPRLSALLR